MSQLRTGELEKYVRALGEHIKSLYAKIGEINNKIEEVDKTITDLRAKLANDTNVTSDLKENVVLKSEFDEFVHRLTESLRELIPSTSETDIPPEGQ